MTEANGPPQASGWWVGRRSHLYLGHQGNQNEDSAQSPSFSEMMKMACGSIGTFKNAPKASANRTERVCLDEWQNPIRPTPTRKDIVQQCSAIQSYPSGTRHVQTSWTDLGYGSDCRSTISQDVGVSTIKLLRHAVRDTE